MSNKIEWMSIFCSTLRGNIFLMPYLPGERLGFIGPLCGLQAFTAPPSQMAALCSAKGSDCFQTLAPITVKTRRETVK